MKNITQQLLATTLILMASLFGVSAQAPQGINYQAVVRDNAGLSVVNGTVIHLRFSIHDSLPTGTVQFSEVDTVAANQFGLVTTVIGSNGNLTNVTWSRGNKYLQVEAEVNNSGTYADMGTTQMQSVPYALFAGNGGGGSLTLPFQQTINSASNAFDVTNNGIGNVIKGTANGNSGIGVWGVASATSGVGVLGVATGSADYGIRGEADGNNSVAGYFQSNSNVLKSTVTLYEVDNDFARLNFENNQTGNFWTIAGYPSATAANARMNFYFQGVGDAVSISGNGNLQFAGALMPGGSSGNAGQVLLSAGANAAPVWQTAHTLDGNSNLAVNGFSFIDTWFTGCQIGAPGCPIFNLPDDDVSYTDTVLQQLVVTDASNTNRASYLVNFSADFENSSITSGSTVSASFNIYSAYNTSVNFIRSTKSFANMGSAYQIPSTTTKATVTGFGTLVFTQPGTYTLAIIVSKRGGTVTSTGRNMVVTRVN